MSLTFQLEVVHRFPGPLRLGPAGPPWPAIAHIGPVRTRPIPLPRRRLRTMFGLLDDQKTTLHANPIDAAGNPAGAFSGPPAWSVSDPSVLTLVVSADGHACEVTTTGKLGTATITMTAPPFAPGGPPIKDDFPITVTADVAATANITADPPTSRFPAATPPALG